LPIEDPEGAEATDLYFNTYIDWQQFRDNLPPFFFELEEILSDCLATSELSAAYEDIMDENSAFNRGKDLEDEEAYNSIGGRSSSILSAASSLSNQSTNRYRTPARSRSTISEQNYQQSVRRISSSLELRKKTAQGAAVAEDKKRKQRGADELDEALEQMSCEFAEPRKSMLPAPERATLLLQEEFPTLDNTTYRTLTMSFIASESAAAVFCAAGRERRRAQIEETRREQQIEETRREQQIEETHREQQIEEICREQQQLSVEEVKADGDSVGGIDFTALDIDINLVL